MLFHPAVFAGGFIWLFPRQADYILKIDVCSDAMDIIGSAIYFQDKIESSKTRYFSDMKSLCTQCIEEKIYVLDNQASQLLVLDCNQNKLDRWDLKYSESVWQEFLAENDDPFQSNRFPYLEDNYIYTLSNFLDYVVNRDYKTTNQNLGEQSNSEFDGLAGKRIYDLVKSSILGK